jgi:hypothetical protein
MKYYSILTPYLVPDDIKFSKRVNLGDGFIYKAIERLVNFAEMKYKFTTRIRPTDQEIKLINKGKVLIIAGANQLNDNYTLWPNFSFDYLENIKVPIIPMGVGYSGINDANIKMSETTKKILLAVHNKINFSSWRCYRTINYINKFLPQLSDKTLMTGCPVIFNKELLNGDIFSKSYKKIIFTPTERGQWIERESQTIRYLLKNYTDAQITMVIHQDFSRLKLKELFWNIRYNKMTPSFFHLLIKMKGIDVVFPKTPEEGEAIYNNCDLHIGSRLHAHLYCLSKCKRSFLTYVDDRSTGFSEYLKFPIVDYKNIEKYLNYDFEIYREAAIDTYKTMQKFIKYLKEIL